MKNKEKAIFINTKNGKDFVERMQSQKKANLSYFIGEEYLSGLESHSSSFL